MGFWAATVKSNTSNMKINQPPRLPVRRSGLPASDPRGASDKYTGSVRGCSRGKGGKTRRVTERRQRFVSPQSCVCVGVCWGSEGPVISTLKVEAGKRK